MQPIILFGGSFDPIHNGHLSIAEEACRLLNAEKVIFIPAKNPRWKNPSDIKDRKEMLELALKNRKNFEISDFEINSVSEVNYSIDTVKYFISRFPDRKLYLLIGYDQMDRLKDWKDIGELAGLIQMVAYARPFYPKDDEAIKNFHIRIIETATNTFSSTDIRTGKDLHAPLDVLNYIVDHELYFMPSVKQILNPHRYLHSISVARTAYEIAKGNHLDPCLAFQAGLFHDIGKDLSQEKQKAYMDLFFSQFEPMPSFSYHQFVSSFLANKLFGVDNKSVLQAIEFHCTGKGMMSGLEKCIYAADKCEPTRQFDTLGMREACIANITKGFAALLKEHAQYFEKAGIDFSSNPLTKSMYSSYLK